MNKKQCKTCTKLCICCAHWNECNKTGFICMKEYKKHFITKLKCGNNQKLCFKCKKNDRMFKSVYCHECWSNSILRSKEDDTNI